MTGARSEMETRSEQQLSPAEAAPGDPAAPADLPHSAVRCLEASRPKIVEKMSEEIVKQLFDVLQSQGVFNQLEKEGILQKNPSRADKLRDFIDAVINKGEEACRKMMKHFKRIDPTLSSELGWSLGPSAEEEALSTCQLNLKYNLKRMYEDAFEGIAKAGNSTPLNDFYTELNITERWTGDAITKDKVPPVQDKRIRRMMIMGEAGSGKTVLTQKSSLDWAEGKAYQYIQLLFLFTFRELNALKEEKFSLVEFIHEFFNETKEAGLRRFEKLQVMFIFDGLDECWPPLDFNKTKTLTKPRKSTSVDVLLTNLIRGKLLPSAHIWVTTRPAAANQIPPQCVHMLIVVWGFTDEQKVQKYFRKKFRDEKQARRILKLIKKLQSLHIMCHIPIFCWITATVLEKILETREGGSRAKILTEIFIHFLVVQTKLKNVKYHEKAETDPHWSPENKKMMESLAKLAFEQLQKGNRVFYESDLEECGIDIRAASVYSGVFTQILREVRGLYQDKRFRFIHLSVQEFLAALHVHLTFINSELNLLDKQTTSQICESRRYKDVEKYFYQTAVDKASRSSKGHQNLFPHFLLGLSLKTNQSLLRGLLTQNKNLYDSQGRVKYIKKILESLFYC